MGRHSSRDDEFLAHRRPDRADGAGLRRAGARPGEVAGAFPVAGGRQGAPAGEAVAFPAGDVSRPAGAATASRRVPIGETSGFRRAQATEATGRRRAVGESSGFRRAEAPGESAGSRRAVAAENSGGRRAPAPGESTGGRRAVAVRESESTGSRRALPRENTGNRRRAGAGESTGSHRIPAGETTGSHRVVGESKRGIAKWPLVSGAFVVLLVLGLLGWGWANSILANRAEAQASACAEGDSNLAVIASPSVAPALTAAADRWNQANTVVYAHCVHVRVQAIDDQRVLLALTGRGNLDSIGGQPAVWIPSDNAVITDLTAARPTVLTSPAKPLAATGQYPCAVLTGGDVDEVQERASQVFRNYLQEPAQQADLNRVLAPGA